ncbi:MAG TPA: molecular chaperone DnaJ, partial [Anaeromyxobacteraceae bacterium]|nr:molecular chaperone DnaJ [Anaeromyxobacteraceae bacterium]
GAPGLGRALAEAPRHVEVGLRLMKDELWAGLELEGASEGAGVRAALADEAVANLTRRIMAALGPREKCERCGGDVYAVHLVRLSGLDEIHGLACPGCARVLRSFWRFGERERRLEKIALGVGLVAEERLRLSGATLVFQMLPTERIRLTARALLRRFRELCLEPNGLELPRDALAVRAGRALLPAGARVPEGPKLEVVTLPKAGETEAGLLARVRARVRARFSAA